MVRSLFGISRKFWSVGFHLQLGTAQRFLEFFVGVELVQIGVQFFTFGLVVVARFMFVALADFGRFHQARAQLQLASLGRFL